MVSRLSISFRMVPLYAFLIILIILNVFIGMNNNSFDYWSPMIDFPNDLISWFLAGLYVVLLFFFLAFIRAKVTNLSFSDLKREIPHSDRWENIQFIFVLLNIFLPILVGLLYTFDVIKPGIYILLLNIWLIINFIPDIVFHLYLVIRPN